MRTFAFLLVAGCVPLALVTIITIGCFTPPSADEELFAIYIPPHAHVVPASELPFVKNANGVKIIPRRTKVSLDRFHQLAKDSSEPPTVSYEISADGTELVHEYWLKRDEHSHYLWSKAVNRVEAGYTVYAPRWTRLSDQEWGVIYSYSRLRAGFLFFPYLAFTLLGVFILAKGGIALARAKARQRAQACA